MEDVDEIASDTKLLARDAVVDDDFEAGLRSGLGNGLEFEI